jgi:DNA-directed RNA polymerase beta' subunit
MRIQFNNTTERQAIDSFVGHCKAKGVRVKHLSITPVYKRTGCFIVHTK